MEVVNTSKMDSINEEYDIHLDESGIYVARNRKNPDVFLEGDTCADMYTLIALAEEDLQNIHSDRPAIRTRLNDLTRQLLGDYSFVNRGMGRGGYEIWANDKHFLTVPAPVRAMRTPSLIVGYAFGVWRLENAIG